MTDLALDENNDLLVINGQLVLIGTEEELTRQRILISLNTFTNTWFENKNFGISEELIFAKGTEALLDQDIKTIITETSGVIKLLEFTSQTDSTSRVYSADFKYETVTGEIVSVSNVGIGSTGVLNTVSVFADGIWNYAGIWQDELLWPE